MGAVVTLTVEQLQELLQAQTQQIQQQFTTQFTTLQTNLEEKLKSQIEQAEENVKQFMKESIEDDDEEDNNDGEDGTTSAATKDHQKTSQDLQFLKDHVIQMEQGLNLFFSSFGDGSFASLGAEEGDQLLPLPVTHEEEEGSQEDDDDNNDNDNEDAERAGDDNNNKSNTESPFASAPSASGFPFPPPTTTPTSSSAIGSIGKPGMTIPRPMMVQRSSSVGNPGNPTTALMEKMVFDLTQRLEQMLEKKFAEGGSAAGNTTSSSGSRRSNPRRSHSMDNSNSGRGSGGGGGFGSALHALRATQKHMEDELETRFGNLEQFIDSRHAEIEAYHDSSYDNLKKLILETLSSSTSGGGGGGGGGGAITTSISLGGGGGSEHRHTNTAATTTGGTPLTREELEAVLDARISAEEEEEAGDNKPLTRDELEAVLDARIAAEEEKEKERRRSSTDSNLKPLTRAELEEVLDARITAEEEEEEARRMEQQMAQQQGDTTGTSSYQQPPGDTTESNKTLHTAMERLIRQQQEWIDMQSSTRDLEQQVQVKLEELDNNNFHRLDTKLESLEKLMLAAIAANAAAAANNKKTKQRSSSKKPTNKTKTLSQIMQRVSSDNNRDGGGGQGNNIQSNDGPPPDDSSNLKMMTDHTPRASNAYDAISVDEKRMEEEQEKPAAPPKEPQQQQQEEGGGGGGAVKSFMNTLNKFKELNKQQEEFRHDHRGMDTSEDIELDDDIDSNASMSVDSSVGGGDGDDDHRRGGGDGDIDDDDDEGHDEDDHHQHRVLKTLQRLESKLDQLDEKFPEPHSGTSPLTLLTGTTDHNNINRERSTNARHSREVVVNTDSIEASIRAEHSKLKQWIIEQQNDEMMNVSESGRVPPPGGGAGGVADPSFTTTGSRTAPDSPGTTRSNRAALAAIDPTALQSIQEKLNVIEGVVLTNQSMISSVPRQLPLVQPPPGGEPGSSNATIDMERRILSNLTTMEKNVSYKLDGIFSEIQSSKGGGGGFGSIKKGGGGGIGSGGDWSSASASELPEEFVNFTTHLKEELTTHLKENIPDYGMAKSVLAENLADIRQIVSEVSLSEVEMLKTQLGVAEEAEQEALQAIMVMKQELEDARESERRALQTARVAGPTIPQQSSTTGAAVDPTTSGGSLWDFGGPFGQLLSQQLGRPSLTTRHNPAGGGGNYRQGSYRSLGASGVSGAYSSTRGGYTNNNRSPKQKLEQWKNQITVLDDKATDLRTMYSQLRGQGPDEWLEQRSQSRISGAGAGGGDAGLASGAAIRSTGGGGGGERKEMEMEILQVPPAVVEAVPDLAPIPAAFNNKDEGDWI